MDERPLDTAETVQQTQQTSLVLEHLQVGEIHF